MALPIFYYLIYGTSYVSSFFVKEPYQAKGKRKFDAVQELIPKEWLIPERFKPTSETANVLEVPALSGILSAKELDITENYTVEKLLDKLHCGEFTSLEVTTAFCKRAAIAQQLTHCCTELMFDNALKRAKELDEVYQSTGKIVGPLHGLPISLKDSFRVPGFDATIGFIGNIGNANNEYSSLPKLLMDLGAVFYVKTNIPQTLLTADSENNIFGRVMNPSNLSLTAGGSTGGEGALLKMRGSVLGIGTDIAGSIRIPPICNGVYGFKPSTQRIPYEGQVEPAKEDCTLLGVRCSAGPLSADYSGLEVLFKNTILQKPWNYDNEVKPVSFHTETYKEFRDPAKKLTIGLFIEDTEYPIHPTIKEALLKSAEKLEAMGHTVINITENPKRPDLKKTYDDTVSALSVDIGLSMLWSIIKTGEPPIYSIRTTKTEYFSLPPFTVAGASRLAISRAADKSGWNQLFIDNHLDAVICPGAPHTAPLHDEYGIAPYTSMWNNFDFPAMIIPIGKPLMDVSDFPAPRPAEELSSKSAWMIPKYDPEKLVGGTPHVQIVCRNLEDEKLLGIGYNIDKTLNP